MLTRTLLLSLILAVSLVSAQEPTVPELSAALRSADADRRVEALAELTKRGRAATQALPQLLELLAEQSLVGGVAQDPLVRVRLLEALAAIGPGDGSALLQFVRGNPKPADGLPTAYEPVHVGVLYELLEVWLPANHELGPAVPALLEVHPFSYRTLEVSQLITTRTVYEAAGEGSRSALEQGLLDPRSEVRGEACLSLARLGPPKRVLSLIEEQFGREQDVQAASFAGIALIHLTDELDPARARVVLARLSGDPRVEVRAMCADYLASRSTYDEPLPELLADMFDTLLDDPEVCQRLISSTTASTLAQLDYTRILAPSLRAANPRLRRKTSDLAQRLGAHLVEEGNTPIWFVFRVYRVELGLALLLSLLWIGGWAWASRRSSAPRWRWTLVTGLPAAAGVGCTVYFVLSRPWSASFFPEFPTLVPLPIAGVVTACGCVGLLALGAVRGGSPPPDDA